MNRVRIRSTLISAMDLQVETSKVFDSKCLECDSTMDMHQPDSDDPALFLGVCADCGRWYRIELDAAGERIWYLAVPTRAETEPCDSE